MLKLEKKTTDKSTFSQSYKNHIHTKYVHTFFSSKIHGVFCAGYKASYGFISMIETCFKKLLIETCFKKFNTGRHAGTFLSNL